MTVLAGWLVLVGVGRARNNHQHELTIYRYYYVCVYYDRIVSVGCLVVGLDNLRHWEHDLGRMDALVRYGYMWTIGQPARSGAIVNYLFAAYARDCVILSHSNVNSGRTH